MARFVDLDVSQKLTAIYVVDETGRRLWRGQCVTDLGQIERAVRGLSVISRKSAAKESARNQCHMPGQSNRGKIPGRLWKVSVLCAQRSSNDSGFSPFRFVAFGHAASACPGFCPPYWSER